MSLQLPLGLDGDMTRWFDASFGQTSYLATTTTWVKHPMDIRVIPVVLCAISLVVQTAGSISRSRSGPPVSDPMTHGEEVESTSLRSKLAVRQGGNMILVFNVLRFIGCGSLFVLSARTTQKFTGRNPPLDVLLKEANTWLAVAYAYASGLSLLSFMVTETIARSLIRHNIAILLASFGIFVYRDLWPLATYTLQPLDTAEGKVLWFKIGLLALLSVGIPLFIPTRCGLVKPEDPSQQGHPEQTASLASRFTWSYLDPLVWMGYRMAHLSHTQIPDIADYDRAMYLRMTSFKFVDPGRKGRFNQRYLFWGLCRTFEPELFVMVASVVGQAITSLISPVCINRILAVLETGNTNQSAVKPWFWICGLFVGTVSFSLCSQMYTFKHNVLLVRIESVLTQLAFEHGLRIRVKAETGDDSDASGSSNDGGTGNSVAGSESASSSSPDLQAKGKAGDAEPKKTNDNLLGKINNLVTTDLTNIGQASDFIILLVYTPLQVVLCMIFQYRILGWSAFVGLFILVVTLPIPGYTAKLLQGAETEKMKRTDARVQMATEIISVGRMVKLFGWENRMGERLQAKREEELKWLLKTKLYLLVNTSANFVIPMLTMLGTYGFYTGVLKQRLTPSTIFSSMAVFYIIQEQLRNISTHTSTVIQGKVSLDRYDDFLKKTELLDRFTDTTETSATLALGVGPESQPSDIGFRNATFTWSADGADGSNTPRSRRFRLTVQGELLFKKGGINLIIGPNGSGKTSMLTALLGEMHFVPRDATSWFNLPREDGVAYASQESWVQNLSIRDNILFGHEYDQERYRKVIQQCALEQDIKLFEAGDMTEVGERGLTLSGGQKARITLARAIYSPAKILLLDDILAALDVHTAAWIVKNCLQGDLIQGRTVILVSHNVALTAPIADLIVSLGIDGMVKSQTSQTKKTPIENIPLFNETDVAGPDTSTHPGPDQHKSSKGKLVLAEEIDEGHVTWKSFKLLLDALAGGHPILFFGTVFGFLMLADFSNIAQPWFLGYWASQYEHHPEDEISIPFYIWVFASLLLINIIFFSVALITYAFGTVRATRTIHVRLMDSVFHSTLRWLDETPVGRIISRFTQDIRAVDGPIPSRLMTVGAYIIYCVNRLGVVVLFSPIFLFPGLFVCAVGVFMTHVYLRAQLSMKRETSNARSPLLSHFTTSIHGLVSVRAYEAQNMFTQDLVQRIDHYTKVALTSWALNCWVALRIDLLGASFSTSLAAYLVYFGNVGAANTGLSLDMSHTLSVCLLYLVRFWNQLEVESNSLERIQGYLEIEHEPKPTAGGEPPAAWPTSGDLRVENLSARYSKTSPNVLHDISFHIKAGERIGVIGRTGSGKSSLTLALLRCIFTNGAIYFDGLSTETINLDALRSNITIIPQAPELLSGSLRENLDPFGQHDDSTLNGALRDAGLFSLQEGLEEGRITLDTRVAGGGTNLSVGQRQILALARAMVRGSKLLILDEATSAIDYKTDSIIQTTLRERLGSDVTVITIAHRLQTIMDADKIMVLDRGHMVEFDNAARLLQNPDSLLKALVEESQDKEILHTMIQGRAT